MPELKAVVRWESALPVRDTKRMELPADSDQFYVISVTGLPMMGGGRPGAKAETPDASRRQQIEARMKESTQLQRKGKNPLKPARFEMAKEGSGMLFFFPRGEAPIARGDKEVTFITRMGPLEVKAKFTLKEMMYNGRLEL